MKFATPTLAALVLAAVASTATANKDDSYYNNGVTNPNIELQTMYWHEGRNVLEDLSQFDKLYVSYHSCAWETPTGGDEDGDGGGDGDDWYLGSVPTFKANVAFSLYGILKGENDAGCSKKTFINSFHSTQGVESFTNALAAAGLTNLFELVDDEENGDDGSTAVTSYCYQDEDEDGDEGDDSVANGDKLYGGASSYGVGCTAHTNKKESGFAIHTYGGGSCDANAMLDTLDTLDEFNSNLGLSKCVPVYTEGDYYGDDDDDSSSPLTLLATSRACRLYDGTGSCPDPYGKLKQYERALQKATGSQISRPWWSAHRVMAMAWSCISIGILLFLGGLVMVSMDLCRPAASVSQSTTGEKSVEVAKPMERARSEGTQKSQLSKALTAVSELSRAASRSLGLSVAEGSKKSRKSSKSNKSAKSNKSHKSRRSSKSLKSTKSNKSSRSNRSTISNISSQVDKQIVMKHGRSHQSELSAASNAEQGIELAGDAEDDKSTSAIEDMVHYFKPKTEEVFDDESPQYGSEDTKTPPGDANQGVNEDANDILPYSAPTSARTLDEIEVTGQEDATSKKQYRKRKWFKKILGAK